MIRWKENGYCDRHQRNKQYDDAVKNGVRWCRMFWRGCENQIESPDSTQKTCESCLTKEREKNKRGKEMCKKENCKFKEKENGYCGKHSRQYFIDLAIAEGKELCDPARGCFKVLENDRRKCEDCRKKVYEQERARIEKRRQENEKVNYITLVLANCRRVFKSYIEI